MEYDIEIKPTKLIRGRALCENIVEATYIIVVIEDEEHLSQESDWIK